MSLSYKEDVNFKELFKFLPDLYLILSPDLRILTASDEYLKQTFSTLDSLVGKNIFDAFPDNPKTQEANSVSNLNHSFQQVIYTKKPHSMPVQHYDVPDPLNPGSFIERYWKPVNTPVLDENGNLKYIVHKVTNVTEAIRSEELIKVFEEKEKVLVRELAEQSVWLRSFFEQAPVAIAIFNGPDYVIELANSTVCEIWGRTREQVQGKPLFEALPEISEVGVKDLLDGVFKTGTPYTGFEMAVPLIRAGKKDTVYFNFTYQAIRNHEHEITGVIVVASDVTSQVMARQIVEESKKDLERLNMEFATANEEIQAANEELNATNEELIQTQESLQVVNQELEERVNKRTTDLTSSNDELYRANKEIILSLEKLARTNFELAQTNSELDNFIYTASHDLKAPISNIEGLIIALKKALSSDVLKDPKVSNVLDFMVTSVERFKNTIQELTHISRLQKDGNELEELVPLTEIVEQVSLDFEVLIKSTHATLHVDVSSCPAIRFSKKNLRSIIFNLISNALKYRHHERSPVIRINTISDNTYCILTVCDNGIGLDATKAAKVFSMFGRLHSHVEGSGVGLYIVKKIIENAGGKIELESEVGKGTTFKVYFPTSKDHSNNDL